jgi:hypothetical protein
MAWADQLVGAGGDLGRDPLDAEDCARGVAGKRRFPPRRRSPRRRASKGVQPAARLTALPQLDYEAVQEQLLQAGPGRPTWTTKGDAMKRALALLSLISLAAPLLAQEAAGDPRISTLRARGWPGEPGAALLDAGLVRTNQMTYHGGPVLIQARLVFIFWGPSFADATSPDNAYAQKLRAFRDQFGTSGEYDVLTQYYQIVGGAKQFIELTNLAAGTADEFDTSTPPRDVTDADVRAEVMRYLAGHAFDDSTIYSVVIPSTSYSSDGSADSCGGPNLSYCTYHSWFSSGADEVKYTIQPYPSCAGCQVSTWTAAQNQEHFIDHETADTVTDPVGTSWYSAFGNEVADICAWSPPPFLSGGYGYQYLWSNASSGCVKTR